MTIKTKTILGISVAAFLLSVTGVLWGIFMPVGAIFLGLFMIFNMLGKESELFDEEQRLRALLAEKNTSMVPCPEPVRGGVSLPRVTAH